MRVQIYIILVLISFLMWGGMFFAARETYQLAHENGIIPNLHIKMNLKTRAKHVVGVLS